LVKNVITHTHTPQQQTDPNSQNTNTGSIP